MPLPVALIAALAPSIIGGISSLLGIGKGKEIPKESPQTSASRNWFQNYLQEGLKRPPSVFGGTMPGPQSAFYNALDMVNRYYTKGKKGYTAPKARTMSQILGLGSSGGGGFNPYGGGSVNPWAGGGYRGGPPLGGGMNPWGSYTPRTMAFRPLEQGVNATQGGGWGGGGGSGNER